MNYAASRPKTRISIRFHVCMHCLLFFHFTLLFVDIGNLRATMLHVGNLAQRFQVRRHEVGTNETHLLNEASMHRHCCNYGASIERLTQRFPVIAIQKSFADFRENALCYGKRGGFRLKWTAKRNYS